MPSVALAKDGPTISVLTRVCYYKIMKNNQKGFSAVEGLLILVIVGLMGLVGWFVYNSGNDSKGTGNAYPTDSKRTTNTSEPLVKYSVDAGKLFSYSVDFYKQSEINTRTDQSNILKKDNGGNEKELLAVQLTRATNYCDNIPSFSYDSVYKVNSSCHFADQTSFKTIFFARDYYYYFLIKSHPKPLSIGDAQAILSSVRIK